MFHPTLDPASKRRRAAFPIAFALLALFVTLPAPASANGHCEPPPLQIVGAAAPDPLLGETVYAGPTVVEEPWLLGDPCFCGFTTWSSTWTRILDLPTDSPPQTQYEPNYDGWFVVAADFDTYRVTLTIDFACEDVSDTQVSSITWYQRN